jgi:carnitine-CoA ligase
LRDVLERRAAEAPGDVFAVFEDGTEWTHSALLELTRATAAGLQALGVEQGDSVVVWLPNGPDVVRFWFAVNYLGAVYVPINTAYRGNVLAHVVENSGAGSWLPTVGWSSGSGSAGAGVIFRSSLALARGRPPSQGSR